MLPPRALLVILPLAALACGGGTGRPGGGGAAAALCGDGLVATSETCDDGNTVAEDGCSPGCTVEDGWHCATAPDSVSHCLPAWSLDLVTWVGTVVATLPTKDSDGFVVPSPAQVSAFKTLATQLLAGNWVGADGLAEPLGYQLVQLVDEGNDGERLMALVPSAWSETSSIGGDGRGLFLWRPRGVSHRALALSAAHPRSDFHTRTLTANLFRQLGARAFFMAGAHRCANTAPSGCSGSTAACTGTSEPFRQSDAAHQTASFFQAFHEALHDLESESLTHLQIHGMDSTTLAFSISDGTMADSSAADHPANRLAGALEDLVAGSSSLAGNSCNRIGDADELCATTNTQGRYSNGVAPEQVCTQGSDGQTSTRFVHAELGPDLRDQEGALGPQTVVDAVATAFP